MKTYLSYKICSFCMRKLSKTPKSHVRAVSDANLLQRLNEAKQHETDIISGSLIHKKCLSEVFRRNKSNSVLTCSENSKNILQSI